MVIRKTNIGFRLHWIILLLCGTTFGQLYEVSRFADDSGLPSRIVHDVTQDSLGYLWVAGNNGLYKFDGQKFYGHYASLHDTTGLRDNKINTVLAGRKGRVWIATPRGLHLMEDDKIRHITLQINSTENEDHIISLFEDSKGYLWAGSYDGLFGYDPNSGKYTKVKLPENDLEQSNAIWGINEDFQGNIWVSRSRQSPVMAAVGSNEFREIKLITEDGLTPAQIIPFKYVPYDENILLVSSGSGLYQGILGNDGNLHLTTFTDSSGKRIASEYLNNTIVDGEGFIWSATWKNYFTKHKFEDGNLIQQEVNSKNGWFSMSVYARGIFEDAQHNIWIPNSNGLYKLSANSGKLNIFPPPHQSSCLDNKSIYGIAEDGGGNLWINTPTDLYRIHKDYILKKKCPEKMLHFTDEQFNLARDLLVDSQNRLWISGANGLNVTQLDANFEPGPFYHFTVDDGLPHNLCNGILEIDPNTFWLGNYSRLIKITLTNGDIRDPKFTYLNADPERDDALVNSFVLQLETDSKGDLWIGTFSGVSKLISGEGSGRFKNYVSSFGDKTQLSNNAIKKIFKDSKDRLWIGTQTGLNLYRPESDDFIQFSRKDGLPSEYILGIAEDSMGYLWIATTNGIFKGIYNQSMQSFVHIEYITKRDGLADNITNRNALYIDKGDNIFIGSAQGVSVVDKNGSNTLARSYNLGLTELKSTRRNRQGFVSIKENVENNVIDLSYRENSIQLNYAVLDFTDPSFNTYRHKFLPVSEDWVETGTDSQLNYYNLSPGEYELVLDGSNNQGMWMKDPIRLEIHVSPPFWKSNVALVLYVLCVLGLMRFIYVMRIRKRMNELEQETRFEKALVREREQLRTENAADFHDELGSKVTKISMFLTLAERTLKEHEDPSSWFGKMRENIKDLSGSFRDLLWVIDPKKDTLSDAIVRLKDFGEELFGNTNTHYTTSGFSETLSEIVLDPQTKKQVVLIFKEAMHNCAKYSASTVVELKVESSNGYSSIQLKDNGKGFDVHERSKGRGLINMKNRSEKIGGQLSIVSSAEGTIVSLTWIPHLSDTKIE